MSQLSASLLLLLTAFIWGTAFVAQDVSTELVGTFTFNGIRFLIGALVLMPFIIQGRKKRTVSPKENRNLLKGGFLCGLALFSASSFQQYAMIGAGAGKAGFITSLYNIFTPLMMIAIGKKVSKKIFFYALLSCIGMYFLSITSSFTMDSWDIYLVVCAFMFALQVMLIDYFIKDLDGLELSQMQFFTVAILSLAIAFLSEDINLDNLKACAFPLLYTGIFSCGIAYTLQVVAQKYVKPNIATLIMSLESVFAALAGFIILSDALTPREIFGCVIVFASVLLSQLT
ncbi:MAG: DMT family transporter [Spirochaetales bacterium]|nr:DMT family transporter [Spirochaetales bacterium]